MATSKMKPREAGLDKELRVIRHPSLGRRKEPIRASKGVLLAANIEDSDNPWRCPEPVVKSGFKPYRRGIFASSFADTCYTSNLSQSFALTESFTRPRPKPLSCDFHRPSIVLRAQHLRNLVVTRRRDFA